MKKITLLLVFVLLTPSVSVGLTSDKATAVKSIATGDILKWSIGLVVVLGLFFLLVWVMKKLNGGSVASSGQMQVLGGLSLGMREKIILLKVGNQQLILGVSPGHIEKLHVLKGEDCLVSESTTQTTEIATNFASKLTQIMQGKKHG